MDHDQEAENVAAQVLHLMTQRGKDAENWQRQAKDWEVQCKSLRADLSRLLLLVGAETPIAAFVLVTTWRTEKAGYQEEIATLRAAHAAQMATIERLTLALDAQTKE